MEDITKKDVIINIVIMVVGALIITGLLYFLLFRNGDNKNKFSQNVGEIIFTKKVSGKYGDLYLTKDGKVYLDLNNDSLSNGLLNLEQEYNVQKNNIYKSEKINAILLTVSNVNTINYTNGYYSIKTNIRKEYSINDNDIIGKNAIDLIEKIDDSNDTVEKIFINQNDLKRVPYYYSREIVDSYKRWCDVAAIEPIQSVFSGYSCCVDSKCIYLTDLVKHGVCIYDDGNLECDYTRVPIAVSNQPGEDAYYKLGEDDYYKFEWKVAPDWW